MLARLQAIRDALRGTMGDQYVDSIGNEVPLAFERLAAFQIERPVAVATNPVLQDASAVA